MFAQTGSGGFARVVSLWLVIGALGQAAGAQYGGGNGTPDHPFLIFTAEQLNSVGLRPGDWDKHFKLMADIDLGGYDPTEFNIIGTSEDGAFAGVFDGNQKAIFSFRRASEFGSYFGLFGFVSGAQARIMNVTLVDPNVSGGFGKYVGALTGFLRDGTVSNCHVRAGRVSGDGFVGGLVGKKEGGSVVDCTATATVHGSTYVGGLVGQSYFGTVAQCRAAGEVVGISEPTSWAVGGLVGENSNATVRACQARCTVTGDTCVGGLVGNNYLAAVDRSSADGRVTGGEDVGGLIGRCNKGIITDCYALTQVTGARIVGGLVGRHGPSCYCQVFERGLIARSYAAGPVRGGKYTGGLTGVNERENYVEYSFWDVEATGCKESADGEAKTTRQMYDSATYMDAGWDFLPEKKNGTEDIWSMPMPNSYPRLAWEPLDGDFNADGRMDLRDYSAFAGHWRQIDTAFGSIGALMTTDGIVDFDDLTSLADAWLTHLGHRR